MHSGKMRNRIRRAVDPNSSSALDAMINRDEFSDLQFMIGDGGSIHAHRILLAVRSDKLRTMLLEQQDQGKKEHHEELERATLIVPSHISAQSVRLFLEYIYCDELRSLPTRLVHEHINKRREEAAEVTDDVVSQLIDLARLYGTSSLESYLERLVAFPHVVESTLSASISNTLAMELAHAFDNPLFSDLTFVIMPEPDGSPSSSSSAEEGSIEIHAHKCMLATRNEYFRAMFLTGLKEATSRRVPILGVKPELFRRILRYYYTGVVEEIDPEGVVELFMVAHEYGIEALARPCERIIESGLDMENVSDLWSMAVLASEQLKQLCISFVVKELNRSPSTAVSQMTHLPRELYIGVCNRILATPGTSILSLLRIHDHHVVLTPIHGYEDEIACGSCREVVSLQSARAESAHCKMCGRVLCQRWRNRECMRQLAVRLIPQELRDRLCNAQRPHKLEWLCKVCCEILISSPSPS